jgi:hypothetical protein
MSMSFYTSFTKDLGVYTIRVVAGAYNSDQEKTYSLRVYNTFNLTITKDAPPVQV